MKALVLLATASAAVADLGRLSATFESWARENGRNYSTTQEFEVRLANFRANMEEAETLNKLHPGATEAKFRPGKFADLSKAEFEAYLGFRAPTAELLASMGPRAVPDRNKASPTNLDYRTWAFPVVAAVQDQARCGSCWAFSAINNAEARLALASKTPLVKLSEQHLVDCDKVCGTYRNMRGCDAGCNGGLMPNAFQYMRDNKMTTLAEYPYAGKDQKCAVTGPANLPISGFTMFSEDESDLVGILDQYGPIAIAVDASRWSSYRGGMMTNLCTNTAMRNLNHAVNIVGYGTDEAGVDFWIVRNSWGTSWGENGYARVIRGKNQCGVALFATGITVKE